MGIVPTLNVVPLIFPNDVPVDHEPDFISYCSISKSAKFGGVGVGAVQLKRTPRCGSISPLKPVMSLGGADLPTALKK